MEADWILYGANGYTGKLIAERARGLGLRPILAGRNAESVQELARRLDLPYRVFGLTDADEVRRGISSARLVLHCAGPYSATSRPMVDACLASRAHYLDITGEYSIIESVLSRDAEAKTASVVLMPAVGFDVVPTDCMAAKLSSELPDASELLLAFGGGVFMPSVGTAKTTVEGLHLGSRVRRNGDLIALPAPLVRDIPFGNGARTRKAMSIPWGDLVSAYYSTRIPSITVFAEAPDSVIRGAGLVRFIAPVLRMAAVQNFLKGQVERRVKGPTEEQRRTGKMWIWGQVRNSSGRVVEGHLSVPDGYELTIVSSLRSVARVLRGDVPAGSMTPSKAFGPDFVTELQGVGPFEIVMGR